MAAACRRSICDILRVKEAIEEEVYLGLPILVGRNKNEVFSYVKERVWKRICSWNGRGMLKAGNKVLIKAVCQAIPHYVTFIFFLPKEVCYEIEVMLNRFCWCGNDGKGVRSKRWEVLCEPKGLGGLGFKKLYDLNVAMLGSRLGDY